MTSIDIQQKITADAREQEIKQYYALRNIHQEFNDQFLRAGAEGVNPIINELQQLKRFAHAIRQATVPMQHSVYMILQRLNQIDEAILKVESNVTQSTSSQYSTIAIKGAEMDSHREGASQLSSSVTTSSSVESSTYNDLKNNTETPQFLTSSNKSVQYHQINASSGSAPHGASGSSFFQTSTNLPPPLTLPNTSLGSFSNNGNSQNPINQGLINTLSEGNTALNEYPQLYTTGTSASVTQSKSATICASTTHYQSQFQQPSNLTGESVLLSNVHANQLHLQVQYQQQLSTVPSTLIGSSQPSIGPMPINDDVVKSETTPAFSYDPQRMLISDDGSILMNQFATYEIANAAFDRLYKGSNRNYELVITPAECFYSWYDDQLYECDKMSKDTRVWFGRVHRMITYMKTFLPDNTNIELKPSPSDASIDKVNIWRASVMALANQAEKKIVQFATEHSAQRDAKKSANKKSKIVYAVNQILKNLSEIPITKFPCPKNVVDHCVSNFPSLSNILAFHNTAM